MARNSRSRIESSGSASRLRTRPDPSVRPATRSFRYSPAQAAIPGYPEPSAAWIDEWQRRLAHYRLTPTNICSWVDNQMWPDRDLTEEEAAAQLARDVRLAHRLGFGFIRPKFGVISPELDPHPTWEETVLRTLDLAAELDVVICPEIHSPTPIKHPVTQNYIEFIERTGTGTSS